MTSTAAPIVPWYRQVWPWILIALPGSVVVASLITFYIAARGWDGPVASDYYKRGLAINEELTRSALAKTLGVTAAVRIDGLEVGQRVRVELASTEPLPPEAALRLRLIHPGRRDADRMAVLGRVEVGPDNRSAAYAGEWQQGEPDPRLSRQPVAWQVVLETQQWRVDDNFSAGSAGEFSLRAH